MAKTHYRSGRETKAKMIYSAINLFLENGYHATKTEDISRAAGMSRAGYFNVFPDKEAVLYALVEHMFNHQFTEASLFLGDNKDGVLLYAFESSIQLAISEINEPLRDLYVTAYSLQTTSELIFRLTSEKLASLFREYLPNHELKDFYELELATGGITRSFMSRKCDIYFTLESKLRRFLSTNLKIYDVPQAKREEVIDYVLSLPIEDIAKQIIEKIIVSAQANTL